MGWGRVAERSDERGQAAGCRTTGPTLRWDLLPSLGVPAWVRGRLRTAMAAWAISEDDSDRALLVINELVSNVVDHAGTPFRVTIRLIGPAVHVHVLDHSVALPVLQPFDHRAARGRGLQMIEKTASRWGYITGHGSKTVWAVIDLAESPQHH